MSLKLGFQMDDISKINAKGDTTLRIMIEAQKEGHQIFYYLPDSLSLKENKPVALIYKAMVFDSQTQPIKLSLPSIKSLEEMDAIFIRQDPPFNMAYITTTYILEKISNKVLFINNPTQVRNSPEKIFVTDFAEFSPPTLISKDKDQINIFIEEYQDVVIKPLYHAGGYGVFRLTKQDKNRNSLLDLYSNIMDEPIIIQKYLPEIKHGDKRIIIIDGEPMGAISRIPQNNDIRSNIHVGGATHAAILTSREKKICASLQPCLQERGILLAGIDVIGDYLTEINVTSPTGIREIENLTNINLAKNILSKVKEKIG